MGPEKLILIGSVSILTSIHSEIGGGGDGFIGTPLLIFLSLRQQQAVASGKIAGLGVTLGSLKGLTTAKLHRWNRVIPLMILATLIGLAAPLIIKNLDNEVYRIIIGIFLLCLAPLIVLKKLGVEEKTVPRWQQAIGFPLLIITLLMQAVLSSGMGTLVVLVLMGCLGMRALEANVTKRFSSLILNAVTALGLLTSGLIVWEVALTLFVTNAIGGYIGSKIALKKGDQFINYVF